MRLWEIAVRPAHLYHGTSAFQAISILQHGMIFPSEIKLGGKWIKGVSMTRDPQLTRLYFPPPAAGDKDLDVMFALDQNELRKRYAIKPFDYYSDKRRPADFYDRLRQAGIRHWPRHTIGRPSMPRSESEEIVITGDAGIPINSLMVKYIDIRTPVGNDEANEITRLAQGRGIATAPVPRGDKIGRPRTDLLPWRHAS